MTYCPCPIIALISQTQLCCAPEQFCEFDTGLPEIPHACGVCLSSPDARCGDGWGGRLSCSGPSSLAFKPKSLTWRYWMLHSPRRNSRASSPFKCLLEVTVSDQGKNWNSDYNPRTYIASQFSFAIVPILGYKCSLVFYSLPLHFTILINTYPSLRENLGGLPKPVLQC